MYVYPYRITPMLLHFLAYIGKPMHSLEHKGGECGKPLVGHSRIVGGSAAISGEYPWMVSIQKDNIHLCGGALIARQWVLTASHCFIGLKNRIKDISVVVGANTVDEMDSKIRRSADKIITHPNFIVENYVNDIALLKLNEPVVFNRFCLPVCLPNDEEDLYTGKEAVVTGWGLTKEPKKGFKPNVITNQLQKLTVKVIDNRMCTILYREANVFIRIQPGQLCAGYKEGGKDACEGDSGGPLVVDEGDSFKLIGVVSTGYGCARPSLPGIYARVSPFLRWIKNHITS